MGKRTLGLFSLAYLLTLFITAPASLLDWGLQLASQGRLFMANASGSLWNGSATPAFRAQDGSLVSLPFLHWEITVPSLLTGKIHARLLWDNQPPASATEAILSFNRIELLHPQLQLPARLMTEASPVLKPAQFQGQLIIQGDRVIFSKAGMEGTAFVDWRQASSALCSIAPLGDYHLTLTGTGDRINIGLSTNSGVLVLDGAGSWLKERGLEFQGKAHAAAGNDENLSELLHNLGPEISQGVHSFNVTPR